MILNYPVEDGDMIYYFSSEFNRKRFIVALESRGLERRKVEKLLNAWVNHDPVAVDLMLYKNIEKRGFRVDHVNPVTDETTAITKDYEVTMKVNVNGNSL